MSSEAGHQANRFYFARDGSAHFNGANVYDAGENPFAQKIGFTIAQGGSNNICTVNMTVQDAGGVAIAAVAAIEWWLSDAATGAGLTATAASGTVGAGTPGVDIYGKVSKKAGEGQTDATGVYQLSITDSGKTGFYVCAICPGTGVVFVSRQLVAGDYK